MDAYHHHPVRLSSRMPVKARSAAMVVDLSRKRPLGAASRHVDALARSVLTSLRSYPSAETRARLSDAAHDLASWSASPNPFDPDQVLTDLKERNLGSADLMDYCIPEATMLVGQGWQDDAVPFWQVSLSGARLYSLVKRISAEWALPSSRERRLGVLLVICGDYGHVLGSALLSDQMRRAGCSVSVMMDDSRETVVASLNQGGFDLVVFTCSTLEVLEPVSHLVKQIRNEACVVPPIVLGGPVMDYADNILEVTGVDLVTRDIKAAIGLCYRPAVHAELKVAE
ncbi:cobalamin B12-binding domain-containing protein [Lutimaribacter sp. EGI FJ00014]|nr:cobalamin B12-binding domain-containing protein [Lutimaribacter sp. EGI FJ00014]